ncbi:alpha-L-fucosidase [Acidicapsa dinghuensis]|uniref:alpha-L-fucosidase n=1 Tax=Acidicapsa dinghuensis TaxID=2218256 RepID=A0ABW1EDX4_9BACT|nr:alpha-L-fucosidase [Acidicapsa dinghuensis]
MKRLQFLAFGAVFTVVLSSQAYAQSSQAAADPLAPTWYTKSAEQIDEEWQKSVSKYDTERNRLLKEADRQAHDGPFRPDWESLRHMEIPQWYKDAKFGIFIHWGVYSVPAADSEWYPRNMYRPDEVAYKDFQNRFASKDPAHKDELGYKDLIPMFKAEKWDPKEWAELFKESGARYVVPVAEHHDGFSMYDSGLSDWTAVKMGPKRDVVGELAKAVRADGLHFGLSSHRAEHDFFFDGGRRIRSDVNDPKYASLYGPAHAWTAGGHDPGLTDDWTYASPAWTADWMARMTELVEKYKPELVYFDWWIGQPNFRQRVTEFDAFYYNYAVAHGYQGVVNFKNYAMDWSSAVRDFERGQLASIEPEHWQTDTSISKLSWGYIEHDQYQPPDFLIHQLIDIVSKNGNLLLNIGPKSDGTIPEEIQTTLRGMGRWLKANGEAIYETTPWKVYGEGPTKVIGGAFHDQDTKPYTTEDFRFTAKDNTIYAIGMACPEKGVESYASIHALGSGNEASGIKFASVDLIGSDAKLDWMQTPDALNVKLPASMSCEYSYVLKVSVEDTASK